MTTQQKLEAIRAACIKANPKIVRKCSCCLKRDIRLADVILAIKEKRKSLFKFPEFASLEGVEEWSDIFEKYDIENELEYFWYHWNLHKDSLDEQDQATIDFIYDLLK